MITLIAAVAKNGAIGYQNKLLYWLPNDLKRFKQLTTGHTIIMGRRTYDSLPHGALPHRRNIVLTRRQTAVSGLRPTGCCSFQPFLTVFPSFRYPGSTCRCLR